MASEITVPVTMTVLPGPEMGRPEGTVQGLGYCDAEAFLLETDLTVQSEAGMSTSLHSAVDTGRYGLWLPVGPHTVTANAAQHVGAAASVAVVTGMTATLNFDLRWNEPCVDIEPLSFSVTLAPDEQRMETVSLANLGAGALAWELRETTAAPTLRATGAELWPADIAPGTTFGQVLLDEGFEGGQVPPPGWSLVQTNERQTWVLSDLACEGDHAASCDCDE